jgi:TPP-dependent pyruvate/acetoin dehydrogenase alpha subunit
MKRSLAYDPPEYVHWVPDPALVAAFGETPRQDAERRAIVDALPDEFLLQLYAGLLRTRLVDVTLKRWVRTGVISKAWLSTGEEAATVGPVHALAPATDYVAPMIRNSGACNEMGMPIADILRGYLGTADGPSGGRDGHYGDFARHILPPISHVGDMVAVTAGVALAMKMRGTEARGHGGTGLTAPGHSPSPDPRTPTPVAMTWIGDGSSKAGVTHEAFNFAAVQKVPAIFIVQNNQVALGTELAHHHLPADFSALPSAYGMWGASFDGNNVLDGYAAAKLAVDRCRAGDGPAMLIANTFRMGGHATHDEREARALFSPELFEHWGRRDPVGLFEGCLTTGAGSRKPFAQERLEEVEARVDAEIAVAEAEALASREQAIPAGESALAGVYADG